ncbi:MAG: hypothetical protein IPM16_13900 [Chloroflexi bacterium]|nr:hypothetical protein [Chloroflexota bacterium]
MRLPGLSRLFGVLLIFAVLPVFTLPVAHAQTPTKGDNQSAPINIALNTSKTVKHIENATMESALVEETSCDVSDLSDHSVWFRFEVPITMLVDIDASGALIQTDSGAYANVVLSYYRLQGALLHQGCAIGTNARLANQLLSADGVYYVRIANISQHEPTGPSRYRLSLRVRETLSIPQDPFIATQPLGVNWQVKKAGNPPKVVRLCPNGCYIRFDGAAGAKVFQKVDFDSSVLQFKPGDIVSMTSFVFMTPPEGSHVKLSIRIDYSDGTPSTKVKATRLFINTSTNTAQDIGPIIAEVAGKVQRMTFSISSPDVDDVFSVLSVEAEAYAGSGPRGVLPVPLF